MIDVKQIQNLVNSLPVNGSYKSVQNILNTIAGLLPKTVYIANKSEQKEVIDLIEKETKNTNVFDVPTEQINISLHQKIMTKNECYFFASNKNRLKKAWNESGKSGVHKYILWVNENNKSVNNSTQNSKVTNLVATKLKIQEFL
jgi:hypothetical protein